MSKRMKRPVLTGAVVVATMLAIGSCVLVVSGYENAFEKTSDGDAISEVVGKRPANPSTH